MSIYELLERQEELLKEIELLCLRQNAAANKEKILKMESVASL